MKQKTSTPALFGIKKFGRWLLYKTEKDIMWIRMRRNKSGLYPIWLGDKETAESLQKIIGGRVVQL